MAGNGEDRDNCGGSSDTPCETLDGALYAAYDGDTILIDAIASGNQSQYCRNTPLGVMTSMAIKGHRGQATIGCPIPGFQPTLIYIMNPGGTTINVSITNIDIINTMILVNNTRLFLSDSAMVNTTIQTLEEFRKAPSSVDTVQLYFTNVVWRGSVDPYCLNVTQCKTTSYVDIFAVRYRLELYNVSIYQVQMAAYVQNQVVMNIHNSLVTSSEDEPQYLGGIYNIIDYEDEDSPVDPCTFLVEDSVFEKQYWHNPIESIANLHEAALTIIIKDKGDSPRIHPDGPRNVSVEINRCQFVNNERGVTLVGPFEKMIISGSLFKDNIAMHPGSGILFFAWPHNNLTLHNCTFDSNSAGTYRTAIVDKFRDSFEVTGNEVRVDSVCCKGVIALVAKGGAIRIVRGGLIARETKFFNNSAKLLGGAIIVDKTARLELENCHFENSPNSRPAMQGDMVYSDGFLTLNGVNAIVHKAKNDAPVFRHSGNHWSVDVREIYIQCPMGYRLRITNTSAYRIEEFGLLMSYKLDQLSYFCESCPRNKYSLDHGYLNYSLVFISDAYFAMLINGTHPPTTYSGTYIHHDIKCLECPYGGRCEQGISAVPNFWGFIDGSTVQFQHCPKGYCCGNTLCRSFNTCAIHRGGRLCGACEEGFSEAMFSSECVHNKYCNSNYLWPVVISSGILYALFLLFQKDMRDAMYMSGITWKDIRLRHSSGVEMNHILTEETRERSPLHATHDDEFDTLQTEVEAEELQPCRDGLPAVNNNMKASDDEDGADDEAPEAPPDTGASFLIILFYYVQDAQLLHVKTVFARAESEMKTTIKTVLGGLFKFRVELFQFMDKLCLMVGITPTIKEFMKVVLVPYVLFQFAVLYVLYKWCQLIKGKIHHANNKEPDTKNFLTRLSQGFVLALLFTYQKLATTSFTLLKCVPVGNASVLFIEGTIECHQMWQYGVMAYVSVCIVPFCLVLLLGPGLLKDGLIKLPQFFCACLMPLPFLIYWVSLRLYLRSKRASEKEVDLSAEAQAVISILQGPFKETKSDVFGPTCGQGFLIGRRLILVVLHTFVNDPLLRLLCMMLVCFIILLHHVNVLPFKDTKGNLAGSTSAAALLLVGGINLIRAAFEAAEYVPQGPNMTLIMVFEEVEDVLMLWFPAAVFSVIIVCLTIKFIVFVRKCNVKPTDCEVQASTNHSNSHSNAQSRI